MKSFRNKVTRLSGFALVTTGLVLGQLAFAPSANAVELVQDGGFEGGASGDSPSWTEADSIFGTPLCTVAACGTGGGTSGPHAGSVWAWFGGDPTAGHTGSMSQSVTIPTGNTATLTYYYWNGAVTTPFDATLTVKIDGTTVKLDLTKPVVVDATLDRPQNTVYAARLVELDPSGASVTKTLVAEMVVAGMPKFAFPPELFQVGHIYYVTVVCFAGGFTGAAAGDLQTVSFPFTSGTLDSGVFTVMP